MGLLTITREPGCRFIVDPHKQELAHHMSLLTTLLPGSLDTIDAIIAQEAASPESPCDGAALLFLRQTSIHWWLGVNSQVYTFP